MQYDHRGDDGDNRTEIDIGTGLHGTDDLHTCVPGKEADRTGYQSQEEQITQIDGPDDDCRIDPDSQTERADQKPDQAIEEDTPGISQYAKTEPINLLKKYGINTPGTGSQNGQQISQRIKM